jgi:hypothetical protein
MFTTDSSTRSPGRATAMPNGVGPVAAPIRVGARTPRAPALCALLAAGLPAICYAQAIGTMQATVRVVPAAAAWAGVSVAGHAARAAVGLPAGHSMTLRHGLVRAAGEIRTVRNRREVLVTIQHPHN